MLQSVAERGRYFYEYREYLVTNFLKSLCCCLVNGRDWYERRLVRLQRHQEASDRLKDEVDIVKLLYVQRLSQFLAKIKLSKH